MWVLDSGWESGYCDYHRERGQVRISVALWLRLMRIDDAFVSQQRGIRNVSDYVREYGLRQTIRKVRSRVDERGRNRKYVSFGLGRVAEVGDDSGFAVGDWVAFLAPMHPACVDNLCLNEKLVRKSEIDASDQYPVNVLFEGDFPDFTTSVDPIASWVEFSDQPLENEAVDAIFEEAFAFVKSGDIAAPLTRRGYKAEPAKPAAVPVSPGKPSAAAFGLGHYCKNIIRPRFAKYVSLDCIHEIDPTQVGNRPSYPSEIRSSAYPEEDERYDVYLISGYHHTHARIAAVAIQQGAAAVIEKPLVTTREDLDLLLGAVNSGPGRIFGAFQRRYTQFNDYMTTDLEIDADTAVHCQCIVYETPLPLNHWYQWPSSQTRIVSNGCHWIDHFLMVNRFAHPSSIEVRLAANGDINALIDLENGASLSMVITDHGSRRLGVRDIVEFRTSTRTATIVDQSRYRSESSTRVLRKKSILRGAVYDQMYDQIARKIVGGHPGDTPASIEVSSSAMLEANRLLLEELEARKPSTKRVSEPRGIRHRQRDDAALTVESRGSRGVASANRGGDLWYEGRRAFANSAVTKKLYNALPITGQNLTCSWAGYQRYRDRYTPHFHETLARWQKSIEGPESALHEIQRERLGTLVRRAREHVPFYRDLPPPSEARDAKQAIEETLAIIPILEKNAYRDNTSDMVARDIPRARLRRGMTSGTTGSALRLFHTRDTLAEEYAAVWRLRQMHDVHIGDPYMTFGGQIVVPYGQATPPFWRRNSYSNQVLFSLYHMTPSNLEHYVEAIHRTDAVYVTGYPSAICLVARAMLSAGRPLPKGRLRAVFTSSESLLAFHRESIELAFGAPVRDRYGTAEFAVSMTACVEANLHVDMEFCIVEVEPQEETEDYVRGNLLVTGLSNEATPFLRYRIGDQGTRSKRPCPCGRPGDVFLDVDGRVEDFVMTPDGRLVGRLDHIFKTLTQIEEAQIRQDSRDAIQVFFVPAPDFSDGTRTALVTEIRRRLGQEIFIDLKPVERIPREANGKFRAVKSNVGRQESQHTRPVGSKEPTA